VDRVPSAHAGGIRLPGAFPTPGAPVSNAASSAYASFGLNEKATTGLFQIPRITDQAPITSSPAGSVCIPRASPILLLEPSTGRRSSKCLSRTKRSARQNSESTRGAGTSRTKKPRTRASLNVSAAYAVSGSSTRPNKSVLSAASHTPRRSISTTSSSSINAR
jgi:hypothetical protein